MKLSIRSKLILIVLVIVAPLLAVTVYSYFMMIDMTRHELSWKIRLVAEEIAKDFDGNFDGTFNVIDALAQHPAVRTMDSAKIDPLFARLLPSYPMNLNILAARPDGFNAGSAVKPEEAHKLNYNDREWFRRSVSGERFIGNLHESKLFKSPAVMLSAPVYDDNAKLTGVIGFPLNLDLLREKIIKDWKLPDQSIVLVADGKGNLLVDTLHKQHVGENHSHTPLMKAAKDHSNTFMNIKVGDDIDRLFYVTAPKKSNWRIMVGVPETTFIKGSSLVNAPYLIAILSTAILGLILAIWIGSRISGNIAKIIEGIKAFSSGKLDQRLTLQGRDELADISGYFNKMAEEHVRYEREIKGMNAQLEQQVEERTAQLVAANRELDSFSYSVSHDLRAPLRSIDGFSTWLLDNYGGRLDAEGSHILERIHNACIRMGRLIDDLLQFSHISRAEIHRESVNLSEMALNIAEELQQTTPERQAEFQVSPDLVAAADPVLIRSVMENLLGNAWKFTRYTEKAVITFGSRNENGNTTYFVRDNGAGFNQEYVDKLFNVFQRLHPAQEFEGSGIGLVSAKKIITHHSGEIWAEGKENEGATFYFTLQPSGQTV